MPASKNKKTTTQKKKKNISSSNASAQNKKFVLLRDQSSQVLIIVEFSNVSSSKTSNIKVGKEVTYATTGRDRGRGVVLGLGTEEDCLDLLEVLENGQGNRKEVCEATPVSNDEDKQDANNEDDEDEDEDGGDNDGQDCSEDEVNASDRPTEKQRNMMITSNDRNSSVANSNIPVLTRPSVENDTQSTPLSNKRSSNEENIPSSKRSKSEENDKYLRSRLFALQEENKKLKLKVEEMQKQWMPRPDEATIEYFGKIVSICNGNKDYDEEKGERLAKIMEILAMSEDELNDCIDEKSLRNTCRRVLRIVFKDELADPAIHYSSVLTQKDKMAAIRDFGRLMHPLQSGRFTNGEINNAMGSDFYNRDRTIKQQSHGEKAVNNDSESADESD